MNIELKELTLQDGQDAYEMLQEVGPGENGIINTGYQSDFQDFLQKRYNEANGIALATGRVAQNFYRLYIDGQIVGYGKLRHQLTQWLMEKGGHISYVIRPSERGKGYGKVILGELLKKAKARGIDKVLITCSENNAASRKIIEGYGGKMEDILKGECRYWIQLD